MVLATPATTTTSSSTRSRRYTTCGPGDGPVHPVDIAPTVAPAGNTWDPLIGFFFAHEGYLDSGIVEGINTFFQHYADCGLSKQANLILPRRDAIGSFGCDGDTCTANFSLSAVDELFVKGGEFAHLIPRVLKYMDYIDVNSTPKDKRVIYLFTNINCDISNDEYYPDFCKDYLPPLTDMLRAVDKNVTVKFVWLTV
ncbi:hypothetical protein AAVH_41195 [Aphelenchoides avenae]|nr:hypothetical protein AAVH_41195 [Aphelenchus avenae]